MNGREQERSRFLRDLKRRGINDEKVLDALGRVPREEFVELTYEDIAFSDQALPIACGQTISQPYVVAVMTGALQLESTHKVLEIGTGSGYQAAVLACLAREIISIERHRDLADKARAKLQQLGFNNVKVIHADGMEGAAGEAPFDRIIVTAAAAEMPQTLLDQLAPGGILISPVGGQDQVQSLVRVRKLADGSLKTEDILPVRFVPLLPGIP
jgi:protein-L-isoaspartate(D-aspartate) O-methyltransferase